MADNTKEVILKIKTNVAESLDGIERLKQELGQLTAEQLRLNGALKNAYDDFKAGKLSEEEYAKTTKSLSDELEMVNAQIKVNRQQQQGYRKDIENEIKVHQENEGSIKQMRIELSQMRKEYESLSKTDREGDKGQKMLQKIASTTDELKKLEQAQGDWRREVGHYQNALENLNPALASALRGFKAMSGGTMDAGKAFQNAIPMLKSFGKQLLALMKIPIVWIIAAIATAVMNLVAAFKRNDEAMTQLQGAFASLEPVMELFRSIMDLIVEGVVALVKGLTSLVTSILSVIPAFDEASTAAEEYVYRLDALEEAEREYTVESAKNSAEIARLRNKASQSDKYTVEQRKKFLEQAIKLEEEDLKSQLRISEEKLKLAKEDAERRHDTSDETKNNIAQLEAAYYNAIANTEAGLRRLSGQMAQFNKQIEKDAKDAAKKIISNDSLTSAERIKGLEEYKKATVGVAQQNLELARQNYENWKKYAPIDELTKENNDAHKQEIADREAELKEANAEYKKEVKDLYSDLAATANEYRKNQTDAQRAYEDAILEGIDDTFEKTLKMAKLEGEREIEDLKEKLKTEQRLTAEAREYINKTIIEKQRQLNERLILMDAQYWSEVRENARQTMYAIMEMNDEVSGSDPNRIVGSFTASIHNVMKQAETEMKQAEELIDKAFKGEFDAMSRVIKQIKWENTDLSDNVCLAMDAIINKTDEFKGKATSNITSFMKALSDMRTRLNLSDKEFNDMVNALRPYMKNIYELYSEFQSLPTKYQTYMSNIVVNQMQKDADRIRKNVLDMIGDGSFDMNLFNGLINEIDQFSYLYENAFVNFKLKQQGFFDGFENMDDFFKRASYDKVEEYAKNFANTFTHTLNWNIKTGSKETDKIFKELGEKYGTTFDTSFNGILKNISGEDLVEEQIVWLLKNYEVAVRKVEQINKDLQTAFQATNDQSFLDAMIDENAILFELRKVFEKAKAIFAEETTNWEGIKLEIQGQYGGESDRELKVQKDLLAVEKQQLTAQKDKYTNQLNYVNSIRGDVQKLEEAYNKINTQNTVEIGNLNNRLEQLRAEAKMFDDTTSEATVRQNAEEQNQIEAAIEKKKKEIQNALQLLADTGFMSVDQLDAASTELVNKLLATNNAIIDNTAQTTNTTTQLWLNSFTRVTNGMGQVTGAFQNLFEQLGETDEKYNAFAEAAAYASIGISMAEGIATAVAEGMKMGWPAAAVFIPLGIATVVGGIASAFSVYNQYHGKAKYATGGVIGGREARTRAEGRRDDVHIMASKGEYVISADKVKQYGIDFFDAINFGVGKAKQYALPRFKFADGGYVNEAMTKTANEQMNMETMRTMMVEAVSEIQPVVSVREINSVQNRVKVKENISKNK